MPEFKAVTTPDDEPIAILELLLVHVPPDVASLSDIVAYLQTPAGPAIGDNALIVTMLLVKQPVPSEYVILTVPAPAPMTSPAEPIMAMAVLALDHRIYL